MNLEEYRTRISRLISSRSPESVLNGSADHAAVLVERMFAGAQTSMRILTRQFNPAVYGADDLCDYAFRFAAKPVSMTRILIEDAEPERLYNHPFVVQARGNTNIEFRHLPAEKSAALEINFSVMDDTGYRFEHDKNVPVAVASFGDVKLPERLNQFFDEMWEESHVIDLETIFQ